MEHIQIPAHVQRMRTEREELEHRIINLMKFITSNENFVNLDQEEQFDLREQALYMDKYLAVLTQRLERALAAV